MAEQTDPGAVAFPVVGHTDLAALAYWVVGRKDPVVLVYQAFGRMDPAAEPGPRIGPVVGACRGVGRTDPDSASGQSGVAGFAASVHRGHMALSVALPRQGIPPGLASVVLPSVARHHWVHSALTGCTGRVALPA